MVFAARVASAIEGMPPLTPHVSAKARPAGPMSQPSPPSQAPESDQLVQRLQELMWDRAGIERSSPGLTKAKEELALLASTDAAHTHPACNMLQVAEAIVNAAATREESRGGHYRKDFPSEQTWWAQRRVATNRDGVFVISFTDGPLEHASPLS
jgi:L-aspartate oxidase